MARIFAIEGGWEKLAEEANYNAREMARLCRLSTRQLQREFRRSLGRTPQDWLNERRLLAAERRLLAGEEIKKLALDLGFKQTSHFHRQFKAVKRMTPVEFVLWKTRAAR